MLCPHLVKFHGELVTFRPWCVLNKFAPCDLPIRVYYVTYLLVWYVINFKLTPGNIQYYANQGDSYEDTREVSLNLGRIQLCIVLNEK